MDGVRVRDETLTLPAGHTTVLFWPPDDILMLALHMTLTVSDGRGTLEVLFGTFDTWDLHCWEEHKR